MDKSQIYALKAIGFLVCIILIGTLGYFFIEEGWSLLDALYMTIITITTVGYGEIHNLSPPGRIFTILLIFGGFGAVAMSATQLARWIVESEIKGHLAKKRMQKEISRMKNHYIICGFGRI
ncbi:MAG: ion channel, partial [Planctomycetota bacterium]